ncbi:UDP-N-acetylglucosamine 1-carboxyvinyltransferase [Govanella unica]|uniref:UDP-N-acetylglucosamine 1-carboxyvinyltransferase n=1 Tax=Govanella unica TaxID=2975056 RepID=A0A9X3TZ80_9PROT|nr:UDP-N-acetylglucosamine 1-carboxyvinyltransferase [Govania unica]MDA5194518.1 UDP-N-acetylglucosamine 1-carboxyvinyltransferase [Govania unica]
MALDAIQIRGGNPLRGSIQISGAKNAALPLMAATLLSDAPLTLTNLPRLADIGTLTSLLAQHGTEVTEGVDANGSLQLTLRTPRITEILAPYDIVRKMRASILVLGPIVARHGEAKVSLPGGCAIGNRPIDLHLKGLKDLGADIILEDGYVHAKAPNGLVGGVVNFPIVSVGATENILMAACLARGTTIIENAAREPEIADLAYCLMAMGAQIDGLGTDRLVIEGVTSLRPATHAVMPDRIEAGSYAVAAAITGGKITLHGARPDIMLATLDVLRNAGAEITDHGAEGLTIAHSTGRIRGIDVVTQPFPGFPTDMQAQVMALMTLCDSACMITETIFENRFMHVPELTRMGADITVHGSSAMIRGVRQLTGAPVMATDLRASMGLVLAGLAATGTTTVNRVYHLDRGYERLEDKLRACGADIERIKT